MKRKTLLALSAVPLALLLSSCFALQGFWIVANTIEAGGQATKATFEITPRPTAQDDSGSPILPGRCRRRQRPRRPGRALGHEQHVFGGPYPLARRRPTSRPSSETNARSNGFNLGDVTGVTFKGYVTPNGRQRQEQGEQGRPRAGRPESRRWRDRGHRAGDRRHRHVARRRRRAGSSGHRCERRVHLHRRQSGLRRRDCLSLPTRTGQLEAVPAAPRNGRT